MILIFAGAGASKAVNPESYPTTVEFLERLPDPISKDKLFVTLIGFLQRANKQEVIDIEKVLWALQEWRDFLQSAKDKKTFPGWLLSGKNLAVLTEQKFDAAAIANNFTIASTQAFELASSINERVYDLYRRLPQRDELATTWLPLLTRALDIDPRVDVFTTNYDLIVEEAIEQTGLAIETGRTRSVTPRLSVDLWDTTENIASPRKTGIFTKLHGSIDWIWGEDGEIFVGTPRFTGSHKQHAIIYPGLKGPPRAAPFTAFHDYLKLSSEAATAAIFIGFAFRDEYINEIVRDRLRPGMPIVVIGLGEQPQDIPFRKGQYNYIADGFTQHTAHQALEWIEKALRQ